MAKKKSIKITDFLKNINAMRAELVDGKSVLESTLFSSRDEYIESLYNFVIKKKDTNVIWDNYLAQSEELCNASRTNFHEME